MKHLIQKLVSLANKCDESGFYKEAEELDSIANKLAQSILPGTPVGKPYKDKNGVMIQTYRKPDGSIVKQPVNVKTPASVPASPAAEERPSFFEKYNPFSGLVSGLGSDGKAAVEQQSKSELPHLKRD